MARDDLTAERLRYLFDYDPLTGHFTRLVSRGNQSKPGDIAGGLMPQGYVMIGVDGIRYFAHRLVWLYTHGCFPARGMDIDHINGVRCDNRLANLRLGTRSENNQNMRKPKSHGSSGILGVSYYPRHGNYRASLQVNGRCVHHSYHATAEEARAAYLKAKALHHPFAPEPE